MDFPLNFILFLLLFQLFPLFMGYTTQVWSFQLRDLSILCPIFLIDYFLHFRKTLYFWDLSAFAFEILFLAHF